MKSKALAKRTSSVKEKVRKKHENTPVLYEEENEFAEEYVYDESDGNYFKKVKGGDDYGNYEVDIERQ